MKKLSLFGALLKLNVRSAFAHGFWLALAFMVLNNSIFWLTWKIFFGRFNAINGWTLAEVTLMYATAQLSWGIKVACFGGTRNLARAISDGELDVFLLQPCPPLPHIAVRQSFASGWGDVVSGVVLAALSGLLSWSTLPIYVLCVACAMASFLAAEILLHSVAFWAGPTNTVSRQLTEYMIMLSCYPQNVYTGWVKVAIYVLLPAAVVGLLPVEFVKGDLLAGVTMVGLTCFFCGAAVALFRVGLRRYASGSAFYQRV